MDFLFNGFMTRSNKGVLLLEINTKRHITNFQMISSKRRPLFDLVIFRSGEGAKCTNAYRYGFMDFLFNGFMDYIICYVELGMDLILSYLLITLCYVELGMDLLFSCLVSCICWFLAWFHIYVVFLMGFGFLKIN